MKNCNLKLVGLSLLATPIVYCQQKQVIAKTNFIIVMADDLGYSDIGCFGNNVTKTPNLDKMAREGMLFSDCHSNGAVSTPTRTALLTGRYQQRAGLEGVILENIPEHKIAGLQPEEVTFANVLKDNGYRTAVVGKWHVGSMEKYNPLNHGFEKFVGFKTGNVDYQSHLDTQADLDWWDGLEKKDMPGYSTELISSAAINFITQNKKAPFCLYVAHAVPHGPCQAPTDPAFRKLGRTKPLQLSPKDYDATKSRREMIEYLDKTIGEMMLKLKELGLEKKTLLVFMSDNGPLLKDGGSALPLREGKGSAYEGGHRVPGIMFMPGTIKAGTVCNQTVIGMDLFPTMVEMAGVNYKSEKKPLDGVSLLPIIKGGKITDRTLFWGLGLKSAVRDGKWKLVSILSTSHNETDSVKPTKKVFLFDLDKDISEKNNLSNEFPEVAKSLESKLEIWRNDVKSQIPEQLQQFIPIKK